jgi:hypothetical protein
MHYLLLASLLSPLGCTKDSASVDTGPAPAGPTSFTIRDIPDEHSAMGDVFSQYLEVFGIPIFATSSTGEDDILHAASVLAEYLDNDEDGAADATSVVNAMIGVKAALVMAGSFSEMEQLFETGAFDAVKDSYRFQDLYGDETHPDGSSADGGFDASLEEVLHLVTFAGYAEAYSDGFGIDADSDLAAAMDLARGGNYQQVPSSYPDGAWFHYDDQSCDYECMMVEYFYWGLTSLLGAQEYEGRCEEIANEWEPCTSELMVSTDQSLTTLLQNSAYAMPTSLPDGIYDPAAR